MPHLAGTHPGGYFLKSTNTCHSVQMGFPYLKMPRNAIRWANPVALLVIAIGTWFVLPGLLPLVVFGLLVAVLGEGLVAFTVSVAGGVGMSLLYPLLFGSSSYNAGGGALSFTDFIMLPMDSVIVGLLFLNAFFVLMFENRHAQTYALPLIRSKLKTSRSRLGWGWVMAAINFCDDLASGGILNRLYENDIKSPGVSEAFKRRMLVMILLLANSLPALIPFSSWTAFYRKVDPHFSGWQFLYILLPLTLILYCAWMAGDAQPDVQDSDVRERQAVIGVDFLRERNPPDPGIGFGRLLLIMLLPMVLALFILLWRIWHGMDHALLFAFGLGLLAELAVVTVLGWWEHYLRPGSSPVIDSPELAEARGNVSASLRELHDVRGRLLVGPCPTDEPMVTSQPDAALNSLNETIRNTTEAQRSFDRLPRIGRRVHPPLKPEAPLAWKLECLWRDQTDRLLGRGITSMVSALLGVYLMLILAEATKVCFGIPANADKSHAVSKMLDEEGALFKWTLDAVSGIDFGGFHAGLLLIGVGVVVLLLGLRRLRLSSAWGVLAIVYPLTSVILEAAGINRAGDSLSLVHACFFGLIVSFGVWCNSTLPTGDNVSIAAEVQERDVGELASLSGKINQWPLILSAIGLALVLGFHRVIEGWWGWITWGVLPLGLAGLASWLGYYVFGRKYFKS